MTKSVGLVLEGGGVKGAYELGALIALTEKGYSFHAVTGTSIGALNGAVMASQGIEKLAEYWEEAKYCPVFDFDDDMVARFRQKDFDLDLIIATGKKLLSAREIIRQSYEHTLKFVYDRLKEEEIRSSAIDFGCVTYNISDMEPFEAMKKGYPGRETHRLYRGFGVFPDLSPETDRRQKVHRRRSVRQYAHQSARPHGVQEDDRRAHPSRVQTTEAQNRAARSGHILHNSVRKSRQGDGVLARTHRESQTAGLCGRRTGDRGGGSRPFRRGDRLNHGSKQ